MDNYNKLPKLKKYDKKFDYAYVFGVYPILDLLNRKFEQVIEVIIHDDARNDPRVKQILDICRVSNVTFSFNKAVIGKLAFKENTYAMAVFKKYETDLSKNPNHILLVNPTNPGNLGTIIRTMIGFEIYNLAIIKPAVDIFGPKVLSSTMGAFFNLNFKFFNNNEEYLSEYNENTLYSFMPDADNNLRDIKFNAPFTLIFGNESVGLPKEYNTFSKSIKIKHSKDIESLNLSVSAGIAIYIAKCQAD